ncbi:wd repeat-containing wrap73 [Trichoderma arundinaceum]|uniref:Wd repeat-containing wrap73 n=1 Tax=Trichoderma arundinaceum TaxID=490622 RepID=A0A395NHG9_TRIAR|nr:wd repeat-containing wrap73 [Trichoderma arundinaceum]
MHSLAALESSPHCRPSPDGRLVATLGSSEVVIRSTESLQVTHVVKLSSGSGSPPASSAAGSSTNVPTLLWAPSSSKLLVSAADQLDVFSALRRSKFHATVRNHSSLSGKPSLIQFGARDTEVLIWSASGLKLVVIDVRSSGAVEIASPKFHQATSATRGLSIRPATGHLALLARSGGRDIVSLHHPVDRQVLRSWCPETLDAQGLAWTPDGQWLLLWESAAQGHRLLLYTADGQHFRTITASNLLKGPDADLELGIKICQLSPNAELCAIGDHSRDVVILRTQSWRALLRLAHPSAIAPKDTLQVWQEQIGAASTQGRATHTFVRATQILSPPGPVTDGQPAATESKSGCSMAAFDASSTLLATRLDDSPCTLWIWDVIAAELRAVLIFHTTVAFQWHASSRELLLVTSQDPAQRGASFVWDPLSDGPTPLLPEIYLPDGRAVGKTQVAWINRETDIPVLFVSDAQHYLLLSPSSASQDVNPWQQAAVDYSSSESAQYDSPTSARYTTDDADEASVMDDTFSFRNA